MMQTKGQIHVSKQNHKEVSGYQGQSKIQNLSNIENSKLFNVNHQCEPSKKSSSTEGSSSFMNKTLTNSHLNNKKRLKFRKISHLKVISKNTILGVGSFGRTYLGRDKKHKKDIAIKIMLKNRSFESFKRESAILNKLTNASLPGILILPLILYSGFPSLMLSAYNNDVCLIAQELLGVDLEHLRKKYRQLSIASVCSIGIQMMNRLQRLHDQGYIHRDIKPQNILLGLKTSRSRNKVHLIDFGLSVPYQDENKNHLPQLKNYRQVVGTALFASINAHRGMELSRRDDIESLIYTLIYLTVGTLPWKNINIKKKSERHSVIMLMKEELIQNKQIQGKLQILPPELVSILLYSQSLQFHEIPDYKFIKKQFQSIIKREGSDLNLKNIDILKNNYENKQTYNKNKIRLSDIDVSKIAFQLDLNAPAYEEVEDNSNNLYTMNEHLMLQTNIDGRSQLMNTQELRDEIEVKLTPQNIQQYFCTSSSSGTVRIDQESQQSIDNPFGYWNPFHMCFQQSKEQQDQEQERLKQECQDHSDFDDNSPKNAWPQIQSEKDQLPIQKQDEQEEDQSVEEEEGNGEQGEEPGVEPEEEELGDVPDDVDEYCNIEQYALDAKQNHLKEISSIKL